MGSKSKGGPQRVAGSRKKKRDLGGQCSMLLLHKHLNSYTISKDLIVPEPYFF